MNFPIVDLSDDVDRAPVKRAERALTDLRTHMRAEGGSAKIWSHELLPIILILREALE